MRFAEIGHALCGEGSDPQDSQERNGWAFHKHMKLLKGAAPARADYEEIEVFGGVRLFDLSLSCYGAQPSGRCARLFELEDSRRRTPPLRA